MPLTHEKLDQIRSDALADDIDIEEIMQHWSEAEATRYFESGGAVRPPTGQLYSVQSTLDEAGCSQYYESLAAEQLSDWLERLNYYSRQELLRRLKVCGVKTLGDRSKIVNALAKAWRAGRIPAHVSRRDASQSTPLPPPVDLWREAVAAVAELRELTPTELATRLPSEDVRSACLPSALLADATLTAAQVVRQWPPEALGDTLEALGWSLDKAKLFLEGCGLSNRAQRPRLGQPLAFWTNQMCERGTEVALYDYADHAERQLGLTSWVVHPPGGFDGCVQKFQRRFGERCVELDFHQVGPYLKQNGIGKLYIIKEGTPFCPDVRMLPRSVRALVHCVFHADQPHGDVYAKISPCVNGSTPVVPHIVRPRDPYGPDLRNELGIPSDAIVFGRHGGRETFSIDFARLAVVEVAKAHPRNIYFVFLNTYPLHETSPNIIYLDRTSDQERVSMFIRTCDAMLHARDGGETFGLACAEFSVHNKPVLTSSTHDDHGTGRMHLDVLGAKDTTRDFFYRDKESLIKLLTSFKREKQSVDYNAYRAFEPPKVMATFEKVFLGGTPSSSVGLLSEEELGLAAPAVDEVEAVEEEDATEAKWVDACMRGALAMEPTGKLSLPGTNPIFLSACRPPNKPGKSRDDLLHVFRSNALATFAESSIRIATSSGALAEAEAQLAKATTLSTGEDPRIFAHNGKVFVVDNTLDGCRLIQLTSSGGLERIYRVALSGKNLTFLPSSNNELLLVHWFVPLSVFRVTLPEEDPKETFVGLECIYAEETNAVDVTATGGGEKTMRDDELRGGTPGRPAGAGCWWGLLHRTHSVKGVLRHDPWSWVVRRKGEAFTAHLSPVEVRNRPTAANVLDPCSLVMEGELVCTTAESPAGWFEDQIFVTGMWRMCVCA